MLTVGIKRKLAAGNESKNINIMQNQFLSPALSLENCLNYQINSKKKMKFYRCFSTDFSPKDSLWNRLGGIAGSYWKIEK